MLVKYPTSTWISHKNSWNSFYTNFAVYLFIIKLDYFLTDQSGSWRWSFKWMAAERSEYTTGKISPELLVKVVYRLSLLTYKLKPQAFQSPGSALTYFILVRGDPNNRKACCLNIIMLHSKSSNDDEQIFKEWYLLKLSTQMYFYEIFIYYRYIHWCKIIFYDIFSNCI